MESSMESDSGLSQNPINNIFLKPSFKIKSNEDLEIVTDEKDCKDEEKAISVENIETEELNSKTDLISNYSKENINIDEKKEPILITNEILNSEEGQEDFTINSPQIEEPSVEKEVENDFPLEVTASISNSELLDPDQKIKLLQKDIHLLKEKHAEMLKSLHNEVDVLKRKNTDLQYILISHGLLRLDENMEECRDQICKGDKPIQNPSLKFEDNIEGGNKGEKPQIDERSDSKIFQQGESSSQDDLSKQDSKTEAEEKQELGKNEIFLGKNEEISNQDQNELKASEINIDIKENVETNINDQLFESPKSDGLENIKATLSSKYFEPISCTEVEILQAKKEEKSQSITIKELSASGVNVIKGQEMSIQEEAPFKRSKIDLYIPSPDVNGNRGYTCSIL